ncbi:hypothetical protein DICVIV_08188 [Dictyocaulus viviparus]|uniref:SPARC/Testican calcium-binding domain-containing protein n=1 Tax=Dictyocaulus viviparus TaxID=29172 RepID=A0A0D8XMA7_DICVI|nr:hypothetical protein DICVIV_08188 [Dictyocaulus viviparus]
MEKKKLIEIASIHTNGVKQLTHEITCRGDVAWMFTQWDGNDDGFLSKDELIPLEGNGREVCLAQFIDMCGK